ncbi:hypothetical protein GCM10010411_66460 [Actinomadura fulvescens]|uniref:Uncharacterized protein n=1 Tax=Actinomadura fulvescens TaxID=46160 RepID=A0ABP6CM74_9ACTN
MPAAAAAEVGARVALVDVGASRAFVDLDNQVVHFQGRVVVGGQPVGGIYVYARCDGHEGMALASGADGGFRVSAGVFGAGDCSVNTGASSDYDPATVAVKVPVRRQQVRISVNGGPPRLAPGKSVTITGRVQRLGSSGWVDLREGRWLSFYEQDGRRHIGDAFKPGGTAAFTAALTSDGLGPITARFDGDQWLEPLQGQIVVRSRWLTNFAQVRPLMPEYPHYGKKMTVSARLMPMVSAKGPVAGAKLELQAGPFRGRGRWTTIRTLTTGPQGYARVSLPVNKRQSLRFLFRGSESYAPAEGSYSLVHATYQTAITKFNAGPEPVRRGKEVTLTGRLTRWTTKGGWRPIASKRISAQYRLKGTKRWRSGYCANGGAPTSANGWFRLSCDVTGDATWRVYYLTDYASPYGLVADFPARSATDYVDVR